MSNTGFLKRREQLGNTLRHHNAKTVVIAVPTQLIPIDGSVEMDASVTEETRTAIDEMLKVVGVGEQDTVIEIAKFTGEVPELISVTQ